MRLIRPNTNMSRIARLLHGRCHVSDYAVEGDCGRRMGRER